MSEPGILPNPIPFGKYYLLERINVGGMAEVYKAKAFGVEGFERLLAVKKILSSIAEDESFIKMFIDEAKIAGQLNHPNIAQIFDLGKVDGSYFIALEYISGKDLKTIFERARRLGEKVSIPRVCYTIMKVCEGLAHAHTKRDAQGHDLSIVHRDISPQNVLMSYEGEVKVIDFGIAKASTKQSQTQVGILKGKFSYMSPEQVRGLHVDHRSDIFSLGIVLYELLTLERLFLGDSDFDTLEKIRKVEMSPPSLYNPHIPKELEDIVLRALARSPDERFQSASEFAEAIERFMRSQGYYYTNKDLAAYMKEAFNADIEFENKKLEYYRSLNLKPLEGVAPEGRITAPMGAAAAAPAEAGLGWGEEEMETQIFDRHEEAISEADIVYAADADERASTVEYDRWSGVHGGAGSGVKIGSGAFSFDDEPPEELLGRTGRPRHPTAPIPMAEPRKERSNTMRGPAGPARPSRSPALVIGVVAAVVVAVGLVLMSRLMPQPSPVTFETRPAEVAIYVNGAKVHEGPTPFTYEVAPGPTTFELRREGYETYRTERAIEADRTYNMIQELRPLAPEVGELLVKTDPPGASILIDGAPRGGPTPFTLDDLEPGSYQLAVRKEGFFDQEKQVELGAEDQTLDLRLRPRLVALAIESEPERASYAVYPEGSDERIARGRTPDTVKALDASKSYRIVVEKSGYDAWEKAFEPGHDAEAALRAVLTEEEEEEEREEARVATARPTPKREPARRAPVKPDPPKPDPPEQEEPVGTGVLNVASKPAARVYIDGQDTGRYTPLMNFKIKSGKHKINLVNPEFGLDKTYYVDIEPGESKRIINR